jgi:hypothetical protein
MSMGPSYPNEVSDLLTGATYAIQHAVTVTRPDPSRAEMAMHIMAGMLACPIVTGSADEIAKSATVYTDALIAALEKAKP